MLRRIKRHLYAAQLSLTLMRRWFVVRSRLGRSMGRRDRRERLPQMGVASLLRGCHAILAEAATPNQSDRLSNQRERSQQLWRAIHSLPDSKVAIRTALGQKLVRATITKSVGLILGVRCSHMVLGNKAHYESLRNALLIWLQNAGADQGAATYTSLRNTAKLFLGNRTLRAVQLDDQHQAGLDQIRSGLNKELRDQADRMQHQQIAQQYQASYVSILSMAEAIDFAMRGPE